LIYLDAKQLHQVPVRLCFNAIAAAQGRRPARTGRTKVAKPIDAPDAGVIVVKETGSGIDPGDLPRIFELFFHRQNAPAWAWICRCASAS